MLKTHSFRPIGYVPSNQRVAGSNPAGCTNLNAVNSAILQSFALFCFWVGIRQKHSRMPKNSQ
jgi:hypothetical protein